MNNCQFCNFAIHPVFNFCPNCGKELKTIPVDMSQGKQITTYLVSFFLPPFGLVPAFKYIKSTDPKVRRVGIISIALTALSIIISLWTATAFINRLSTDLIQYQNLGI